MVMLAIPLIFVALVLLARWRFESNSDSSRTLVYKGERFSPLLGNTTDYAGKPISLIRRVGTQYDNISLAQALRASNAWIRRKGLNQAYLDIPENAWSFGHGMGTILNKIVDPGYLKNIKVMIRSLIRYMDRTEAQEHTAKCTTEETHRCALEWTTRSDVELFSGVTELTHNVVVRTMMGDDFYESSGELLDLMHVMQLNVGSFWSLVLPDWIPLPPARRIRHARERVKEIFWERLNQRHVAAKNGDFETDLPDYITYMLHDENTALLKHYFPSHHTALMLASHTSTATVISWVVVCLLRHPDVMAAVKRDARNGENDSVLLQACIKETTRYYAGMKCFHLDRPGLPYTKPHEAANYSSSDTWMPGRWLNAENRLVNLEDRGGKESNGGRPRCPGQKMAAIIVSQTLTTLLRCYDITWALPDQPRTVQFEDLDYDKIGLSWLKGGLRVKFSRRVWPELVGGC